MIRHVGHHRISSRTSAQLIKLTRASKNVLRCRFWTLSPQSEQRHDSRHCPRAYELSAEREGTPEPNGKGVAEPELASNSGLKTAKTPTIEMSSGRRDRRRKRNSKSTSEGTLKDCDRVAPRE
ncbi:hypothetical protein EVAR_102198_1 [Eumeta japonica]|uniref:Uncharacterized protein n=1 Tax=Eumeta variegata TaxID=151549 RepID=A0A4C1WGK8_EUMVA|nr:hypothetical protein EVAR_102198_1 [Eumeta japonica]